MASYCPKCLNNTLDIKSRGVVQVIVNSKQMDTGRFLYNLSDDEDVAESMEEKLEDFFKWYSNFQNKDPIEVVELLTTDFACENKCPIDLSLKFTIVDVLISRERLEKCIKGLAVTYDMALELK